MSFAMLYPESNGITLTVCITHLTSEEYETAVNRQCTHILQINTESTAKYFFFFFTKSYYIPIIYSIGWDWDWVGYWKAKKSQITK
jgi:hypothetical protein